MDCKLTRAFPIAHHGWARVSLLRGMNLFQGTAFDRVAGANAFSHCCPSSGELGVNMDCLFCHPVARIRELLVGLRSMCRQGATQDTRGIDWSLWYLRRL
jgi:hypothetical protein